jgi:myo-inositol-1(or 4)-monophosphatase
MNVMVGAARKAGRSLARDFGEVEQLQVSMKGPANFVSAADTRAEEILHKELLRARQATGSCSRRLARWKAPTAPTASSSIRSTAPPISCTASRSSPSPLRSNATASWWRPHLNPASNEMFTAERGKGAFLNDRRIRVAARTELADCVIVTGIPHRGKPGQDLFLREMEAVMSVTAGVRRTGAAALDLAWVAAGRFDGFWERNLRAWDLAAGIVILREAGGFVSDAEGKDRMLETGSVVAGNETIQRKLLKQLKAAQVPRDAVAAADPSR